MSLGNASIVAFIPTTDPARARDFYVGVLGLTVEETNDFASVLRGGGTMLRVTTVASFTPHPFTVLGWSVDDIAATMATLGAAGVTFNRYEGFGQDEAGVWTAPSGARIAWFPDPDGNVLSLTQA
jgi:catechol 2,3-dioxygenase-like lactoylglutathione lyase family enzyme